MIFATRADRFRRACRSRQAEACGSRCRRNVRSFRTRSITLRWTLRFCKRLSIVASKTAANRPCSSRWTRTFAFAPTRWGWSPRRTKTCASKPSGSTRESKTSASTEKTSTIFSKKAGSVSRLHKQMGFHANVCVLLRDRESPSHTALGRYDVVKREVIALRTPREGIIGVRPRNKEQSFAIDLLLDESVRIVTLVGKAGTGKTRFWPSRRV